MALQGEYIDDYHTYGRAEEEIYRIEDYYKQKENIQSFLDESKRQLMNLTDL